MEQQMLLDVVQRAYATEVLQSDLINTNQSEAIVSSNIKAKTAIELFRKMRTHCNFLEDLDSLGDMNNAKRLRDLI